MSCPSLLPGQAAAAAALAVAAAVVLRAPSYLTTEACLGTQGPLHTGQLSPNLIAAHGRTLYLSLRCPSPLKWSMQGVCLQDSAIPLYNRT